MASVSVSSVSGVSSGVSGLTEWLDEQDMAKKTPKYVNRMKERFEKWLHELMVRTNCSMSMVTRCVSYEELLEYYMDQNKEELERYEEIIREEKTYLIKNGEDEYELSYRETE